MNDRVCSRAAYTVAKQASHRLTYPYHDHKTKEKQRSIINPDSPPIPNNPHTRTHIVIHSNKSAEETGLHVGGTLLNMPSASTSRSSIIINTSTTLNPTLPVPLLHDRVSIRQRNLSHPRLVVQPKPGQLDLRMHRQRDGREHRFSEKVEDTVVDHLSDDRDAVSTLGETPADRVVEPDDHQPNSKKSVRLADVGTDVTRDLDTRKHVPENPKHSHTPHRVIPPLVTTHDQGSSQASDNHNQIRKDGGDDDVCGETGGEEEFGEEEGGSDEPVDVADVSDLTRSRATELDGDGGETEVGGEGEVGDGGGGQDGDVELRRTYQVKDPVPHRLEQTQSRNDDTRQSHDAENSPQPRGAILGQSKSSVRGVCSNGIVTTLKQERVHHSRYSELQ
ncbi:hypothetical protein G7K_1935-t1 [Saitoella complicata NRRL Y-17804]|uniref:Uncharacterized protein n=1 Tax=Saitoella complicata (strain BCRC 22490 / CBS 7301 / JCM 7358 / NBRC 10748 / NRRL Y-17804) TaxID=698492 RepID=A0A0E9NDD7_SAICN|nr:hypothetical protein G7K_1935-t1 [Saitoella complicata NRRL Y-17804]